jgi:hypothetical protein
MSSAVRLTYGIYYNLLVTVKTAISAVFWLNAVIGFGKDSFINTSQRRNFLLWTLVISSLACLGWSMQKLYSIKTIGWLTPYVMAILSGIDLGMVLLNLQVLGQPY